MCGLRERFMLKIILILAVVAIAGFLAYAATKPNSFSYERRITINAVPANNAQKQLEAKAA